MASPSQFTIAPVAVKASPLPPVPDEDPLTKDQWRTLMAFSDTVIPTVLEKGRGASAFKENSVSVEQYGNAIATIQEHALRSKNKFLAVEYLEERPSQIPAFRANVHRFIGLYMPKDLVKLMQFGLNMLKWGIIYYSFDVDMLIGK